MVLFYLLPKKQMIETFATKISSLESEGYTKIPLVRISFLADLSEEETKIFLDKVYQKIESEDHDSFPTFLEKDGTVSRYFPPDNYTFLKGLPISDQDFYNAIKETLAEMTGNSIQIADFSFKADREDDIPAEREKIAKIIEQESADLSGIMHQRFAEILQSKERVDAIRNTVQRYSSISLPRTEIGVEFEINGMKVVLEGKTGILTINIDENQTYTVKPKKVEDELRYELAVAPGIVYGNKEGVTYVQKQGNAPRETIISAPNKNGLESRYGVVEKQES